MNLDQLQSEVQRWAMHNFPDATSMEPLMGLVEESGELAESLPGDPRISGLTILLGRLHHAFLKRYQRIRLSEDHNAAIRDAVGDITIYLAHFCALEGISLDDCVNRAWEEVKKRDWRHENP